MTFGLWIDFQQTTSGGFHHLSSFEVKHLVSCLALNTTHNTRFLPNRPPSGWVVDSEEMKFWWPKSLQKVISVPLGFSRGACHVRSRHPTAGAAGAMRSSRATACWASSIRYHNAIEHEGVGQGAPRGKARPSFQLVLAPPTLRCDGGHGSAARATAARASWSTRRSTRPARSGCCGGATAAAAVRPLHRHRRGARR